MHSNKKPLIKRLFLYVVSKLSCSLGIRVQLVPHIMKRLNMRFGELNHVMDKRIP
ncbi:hypothetical protein D3C76_1740540 [compost metagenome]